jgi:transcriptional regulator with XRE-family HTH domain
MTDNLLFAKRLKAARLRKALRLGHPNARGYSQEQLGIDAGIDEESASARMNQYEQGTRLPDLGTAARLAQALEVPMAYLYCPEDEVAELLLAVHGLEAGRVRELVDIVRVRIQD